VHTANDSENGNWTYAYDAVNRLQTAAVAGQNFTYNYTADGSSGQFGNMVEAGSKGGSKGCQVLFRHWGT
jgi:hypothetical protein